MKRLCLIFSLTTIVVAMPTVADDDFVDDIYFSERTAFENDLRKGNLKPVYNKNGMQQLVFLPDTLEQSTDTVGITTL